MTAKVGTATATTHGYDQAGHYIKDTPPTGSAVACTVDGDGLRASRQVGGRLYRRARVYGPTTGQFLTRDPLVQATRAPYTYAKDDRLDNIDPSGLWGLGQLVGAVQNWSAHHKGIVEGIGITLGVAAASTGFGAINEGSVALAAASVIIGGTAAAPDAGVRFNDHNQAACIGFGAGVVGVGAGAVSVLGAAGLKGRLAGIFGTGADLIGTAPTSASCPRNEQRS